MSVNVNLSLRITGLSTVDARADVITALRQLFAQEGIDDDVLVAQEGTTVIGQTPYPLIISGFHRWRGTFEGAVRSAVGGVAPHAVVEVEWGYPDAD